MFYKKEFIPVKDLIIELDESKTTGYDFTVEDYYTFCTDDGIFVQDSMSLIHPLSDESQKEIAEKMTKTESLRSLTGSTIELSKEMYLGLYVLTKPKKKNNRPVSVTTEDLEKINDPYIMVQYRGHLCTAGFAIYNSCFPKDYPFLSEQATKKSIKNILINCQEKYNSDIFKMIVDKLSKNGFKWATIAGSSFTLKNLDVPSEINKIKKEMEGKDPETVSKLLNKAQKIIEKYLHDTGLGDLIESGCAKGYSQTMQILVAKGLISSLEGDILPGISTSFLDGLPPDVFFTAGAGARSGMVGRAVSTAETGYLARKLVYFLNGVELHPSLNDCKTDKTIKVSIISSDQLKKLKYRYIEKNGKIIPIEEANIKVGDTINLRSPVYCKSKKICHTCHGKSFLRKATPFIGITYGLIMGEAATQSSMEKFHTGGAIKIKKKDLLSDLIINVPHLNKNILNNYISVKENQLITKHDCKIQINVSELNFSSDGDYFYNEDSKKLVFNNLIAEYHSNDTTFPLLYDYTIDFDIVHVKFQDKEQIILEFVKGETLLTAPLEDTAMTALSRYLDRLIGGRIPFFNVEHLFSKIYQQYKDLSGLPLIAYEVLLSQILRYKKDIQYPARLGKEWDPILINMRKTIFNEGFIQGMAFENINEAIRTGLTKDTSDDLNILERVFTGEELT